MFTGIVSDIGTIAELQQRGDLRAKISCSYDMSAVDIGASICCAGICLTVVEKGSNWFAVDISAETISCTEQGQFSEGRKINLERALKVGEELGGHIVTGHIDGVGEVVSWTETGDSHTARIKVPSELAGYVAPKGSITVNGVSLTVNAVEDSDAGTVFDLNIIPHTAAVTTLGELEAGRAVNLEIDILARYLFRMEKIRSAA
ncbi:riboflavin synthase [Parasphingorhabdus halotolerans]|uniref:Riboflavin synthase n=1 Tax=Parasphingorhabdus halotolerans TaxID=2725558 RepID=A0A6H2DNG2_9SPHN|nr:riboflavin synthase [Parasphingorhabdus halotolerans]QJB69728.1 riboflavin synthase [Parasphingorhabdus halotolerans]